MLSESPRILEIHVSPGHDFKGRHGKSRLRNETKRLDEVEMQPGIRDCGVIVFLITNPISRGKLPFSTGLSLTICEIASGLASLDFSKTRRNVLTAGIDLDRLIGKRFSINGVAFVGVEECAPCYWMDEALGPGAEEMLKGRGGLRCRILSDGILKVGKVDIIEHE